MSFSPCCRPVTSCQPPPCTPYCIPPPPYYYQTPCTSYPFPPCTPCYPPPPVCQQPCSPCTPCNPPSCCPPPSCPKSTCCGGCNGTIPIVSIQRQAQLILGGSGPGNNSRGGQKKSGGQKSGNNDQQSSYNNCNFYMKEIPPSLRDKFGLKSNYGANDECMEEDATTVCTEETEDCTTISRDDEDSCDESIGRDRDDSRCQGTTQGNQWQPCFPPMFNPYCFPFFPFGMCGLDFCGMGGQGACGMSGQGTCGIGAQGGSGRGGQGGFGRGGQGGSGRGGQGGFRRGGGGRGGQGGSGRSGQGGSGRGGQGGSGRGGQGGFRRGGGGRGAANRVKGSGTRNEQGGNGRGGAPYGSAYNGGNDNGRGNGNFMSGSNVGSRNPNAGLGGEGNPYGRYTANDNCIRPSRRGLGSCANMRSQHSLHRVGSKKSRMSTKSKRLKSTASSRLLGRMSGYRPYTYSNKELTQKSSAYLPEKYDQPPPHAFNKSIHPSRAPISDYSRYDPTEVDMPEFSGGKSLYGNSNTTRPGQSGIKSSYGPSSSTRLENSGVESICEPSNATQTFYNGGNSSKGLSTRTRQEFSQGLGKSTLGTFNATRPTYSGRSMATSYSAQPEFTGVKSSCGPSNATRPQYIGGNSFYGPSNETRPEYSEGQSSVLRSNGTRANYNGGNSSLGPSNATRMNSNGGNISNATRTNYNGGYTSYGPTNGTRPEYTLGQSMLERSNTTRQEYSGMKSTHGPSNGTQSKYNGGNTSVGPSNATRTNYTGGNTFYRPSNGTATPQPQNSITNSTIHYSQRVGFPTTSSKSTMWETQAQISGAPTHSRSEPNVSGSTRFDENQDLVPVYRTSTQTSLQIIEKGNSLSEIRVIQRPIQIISAYDTTDAATQNCHEDADAECGSATTGTGTGDLSSSGWRKRKKRASDPCQPQKCLKPHARRLHRLCSITNRRTKRLSQIHKPIFNFEPPPCPIRETFASILRKKPPTTCRNHYEDVPPFHEYCMTNHCPDTNRYPLLTRDQVENCGDDQNLNQYQSGRQDRNSRTVHTRGAKRKQHHR